MLRKMLVGALVLAVLAVIGGYLFSSNVTLRALVGRAERDIEKAKSNEQLLEELKIHISNLSTDISNHQLKLLKTHRLVKAMEDDLAKYRAALEGHVLQLAQAKKILSNTSGEITLVAFSPGRRLTRAEVETDVKKRLQELSHLKSLIESKENSLQLLKATHEQGKKALQEANVVKHQKIAELENLALRLKNAEQLAEIRSVADDLKNSFAAMQSTAFQKSWRELLDRVDAAEITLKNSPSQPGLIDYRENVESSADLVRAIDTAINTAQPSSK